MTKKQINMSILLVTAIFMLSVVNWFTSVVPGTIQP